MRLDVVVSPAFLKEDDLKGCICTVVDILRATSTITTAMVSGAAAIHPCVSIEEARENADSFGRERALLGGEEKGLFIPGFDLGNSPLEYLVAETVRGKDIFFYTSNGTGAIRKAYESCGLPVYIAALINITAASSVMVGLASSRRAERMVILCSGRYGNPSAEDLFCAGLIVQKVAVGLEGNGITPEFMDGATIAAGFAAANQGHSYDILASSDHGRYLQSIGFSRDLEYASQLDTHNAVPLFNGKEIVLG
jgi:2-phosphosulfolactate phosphatase